MVEPVRLTFAYPWDGSGILKRLKGKFEGVKTNIVVEPQEGGSALDYLEALKVAFDTGDLIPDVMLLHDTWIPFFVEAGYIRPIQDLISDNWLAEVLPGMVDVVRMNGNIYGVPLYQDTPLVYYRTDLIEHPPTTMQEFEEVALRAMKETWMPSIWILPGNSADSMIYFGAEILSAFSGLPRLREEPASIPEEHTLEAFKTISHFIEKGILSSDVLALTPEACRLQFERGQALFMWNWSYAWKLLSRPDSPLYGKVGVMSMPITDQGAKWQSVLSGWVVAVSKDAAYPEETGHFIDYLASNEAQLSLAVEGGLLPSRRGLYQQTDWQQAMGIPSLAVRMLKEGRTLMVGPDFENQTALFHNVFTQGIGHDKDANSLLDAFRLGLTREGSLGDEPGNFDSEEVEP